MNSDKQKSQKTLKQQMKLGKKSKFHLQLKVSPQKSLPLKTHLQSFHFIWRDLSTYIATHVRICMYIYNSKDDDDDDDEWVLKALAF